MLGGAVAAAIAPPGHRRAALLAGAALGTLPDLDALWLGFTAADPVANMIEHRSFSHSLLVLPWVAALIWWLFKRFGNGRVAQSPLRWFWAIQLALVTHPLLDAFTVYGTQLWWPLRPHPTMGSSVFIIDPGYTVWLLLGCVLAWFGRARPWVGKVLGVALLISSGYLGWGLIAKAQVDRAAQQSLDAMGLGDAPRFGADAVQHPAVAGGGDDAERLRGGRPLAGGRPRADAVRRPRVQRAGTARSRGIPAVQLTWFNRGFMRAQVMDGRLVLSDLRMGLEPDYTFNFAVAEQVDGQWRQSRPSSCGRITAVRRAR